MSDRLTSLLHKIDCLTDQEMWQLMKDVGALRGALTAEKERSERLEKEMRRYLPILERVEANAAIWDSYTKGTGVATVNGYRAALGDSNG